MKRTALTKTQNEILTMAREAELAGEKCYVSKRSHRSLGPLFDAELLNWKGENLQGDCYLVELGLAGRAVARPKCWACGDPMVDHDKFGGFCPRSI